jgi:hypothetical protein
MNIKLWLVYFILPLALDWNHASHDEIETLIVAYEVMVAMPRLAWYILRLRVQIPKPVKLNVSGCNLVIAIFASLLLPGACAINSEHKKALDGKEETIHKFNWRAFITIVFLVFSFVVVVVAVVVMGRTRDQKALEDDTDERAAKIAKKLVQNGLEEEQAKAEQDQADSHVMDVNEPVIDMEKFDELGPYMILNDDGKPEEACTIYSHAEQAYGLIMTTNSNGDFVYEGLEGNLTLHCNTNRNNPRVLSFEDTNDHKRYDVLSFEDIDDGKGYIIISDSDNEEGDPDPSQFCRIGKESREVLGDSAYNELGSKWIVSSKGIIKKVVVYQHTNEFHIVIWVQESNTFLGCGRNLFLTNDKESFVDITINPKTGKHKTFLYNTIPNDGTMTEFEQSRAIKQQQNENMLQSIGLSGGMNKPTCAKVQQKVKEAEDKIRDNLKKAAQLQKDLKNRRTNPDRNCKNITSIAGENASGTEFVPSANDLNTRTKKRKPQAEPDFVAEAFTTAENLAHGLHLLNYDGAKMVASKDIDKAREQKNKNIDCSLTKSLELVDTRVEPIEHLYFLVCTMMSVNNIVTPNSPGSSKKVDLEGNLCIAKELVELFKKEYHTEWTQPYWQKPANFFANVPTANNTISMKDMWAYIQNTNKERVALLYLKPPTTPPKLMTKLRSFFKGARLNLDGYNFPLMMFDAIKMLSDEDYEPPASPEDEDQKIPVQVGAILDANPEDKTVTVIVPKPGIIFIVGPCAYKVIRPIPHLQLLAAHLSTEKDDNGEWIFCEGVEIRLDFRWIEQNAPHLFNRTSGNEVDQNTAADDTAAQSGSPSHKQLGVSAPPEPTRKAFSRICPIYDVRTNGQWVENRQGSLQLHFTSSNTDDGVHVLFEDKTPEFLRELATAHRDGKRCRTCPCCCGTKDVPAFLFDCISTGWELGDNSVLGLRPLHTSQLGYIINCVNPRRNHQIRELAYVQDYNAMLTCQEICIIAPDSWTKYYIVTLDTGAKLLISAQKVLYSELENPNISVYDGMHELITNTQSTTKVDMVIEKINNMFSQPADSTKSPFFNVRVRIKWHETKKKKKMVVSHLWLNCDHQNNEMALVGNPLDITRRDVKRAGFDFLVNETGTLCDQDVNVTKMSMAQDLQMDLRPTLTPCLIYAGRIYQSNGNYYFCRSRNMSLDPRLEVKFKVKFKKTCTASSQNVHVGFRTTLVSGSLLKFEYKDHPGGVWLKLSEFGPSHMKEAQFQTVCTEHNVAQEISMRLETGIVQVQMPDVQNEAEPGPQLHDTLAINGPGPIYLYAYPDHDHPMTAADNRLLAALEKQHAEVEAEFEAELEAQQLADALYESSDQEEVGGPTVDQNDDL